MRRSHALSWFAVLLMFGVLVRAMYLIANSAPEWTESSLNDPRNWGLDPVVPRVAELAFRSDSTAGEADSSDLRLLMRAAFFSASPVGYAGEVQEEVFAWWRVVHSSDAPERFRELVIQGSPAGKLYGLCGLRVVDQAAFDELADEVRALDETTDCGSGCFFGADRPLRFLIDASGRIRSEAHPPFSDSDIKHGDIPAKLLKWGAS